MKEEKRKYEIFLFLLFEFRVNPIEILNFVNFET